MSGGHIIRHHGGTEHWMPGELAECISDAWRSLDGSTTCGPAKGEIRAVASVFLKRSACGCTFLCLTFARYDGYYLANSFRKVVPRADEASRAEAAFIASLKPARIPQPEAA